MCKQADRGLSHSVSILQEHKRQWRSFTLHLKHRRPREGKHPLQAAGRKAGLEPHLGLVCSSDSISSTPRGCGLLISHCSLDKPQ